MRTVIYRREEPFPVEHNLDDVRLGPKLFGRGVLRPNRSSRLVVLALDGAGILNNQFVATTSDAVAAMRGVKVEDLAAVGREMVGSLTVYLFDEVKEEAYILIDPLGGSLTFTCKEAAFSGASSYVDTLSETA